MFIYFKLQNVLAKANRGSKAEPKAAEKIFLDACTSRAKAYQLSKIKPQGSEAVLQLEHCGERRLCGGWQRGSRWSEAPAAKSQTEPLFVRVAGADADRI